MLWMNGLEIHKDRSGPPKEDGIWMDWWVEGTWNWSSGDLGVCPGSSIDVCYVNWGRLLAWSWSVSLPTK